MNDLLAKLRSCTEQIRASACANASQRHLTVVADELDNVIEKLSWEGDGIIEMPTLLPVSA